MSVFNPDIAAKAMMPKELLAMASSLHLAIHIHDEMVQVLVYDFDAGEVLWVEFFEAEDQAQGDLQKSVDFVILKNWGEKVFRKVSVTFDYPDFTLTPQGFLIEGKEQELLAFATGRNPDCTEVQELSDLQVAIIYDLPLALQALASRFPNVKYYSSVSFFLQEASRRSAVSNDFHILVQKGFMLVAAFHDGEMKLTNHYGIQSNDDVLYHIANASMRLGIHMSAAQITLYGASATAELQALLSDYIHEVRFWERPADLKSAHTLSDHQLYAALIHCLCA
ncbi:MAG: DUF3822 family protein [Flavobacteriales bacterium]|jgi:hypothetical protein